MLRAVFVGLLCASVVAACKSGSDSAKSQPGVAAGKVLEVSGTVTVRHKDVARPLAAGETVEGDDTIETGPDGHVVIELAHNLAKWELGANKKQVVRESMAWKLAKNDGTAKAVDQDTSAAGRPAERNAAETGASAPREEAAPAAGAAPNAAAAPTAAPQAPPADKVERKKAAPAPAPRVTRGGGDEKALADDGLVGRARTETKAAKAAPGGGGAPTADQGGPTAHDLVSKQSTAIKACLTKDMPEVDLVIAIGATGIAKVTVSASTTVPAKVKSCVTAAIQKIKFAKDAATVKMKVSR